MILLRYPILAGTNSCIFNRRASLRDSRQQSINGALMLRGCAPNAACTHCRVIECQNGTVEPRLRTPAQSHEYPVKTGIFYGPLTFCINGVWLYLWWKGVLHVGTKQQQQLYLFFSCRFSGDLPCWCTFFLYHNHFKITSCDHCNLIGYQQCDLFTNHTIFWLYITSVLIRVIYVLNHVISVLNRTIFALHVNLIISVSNTKWDVKTFCFRFSTNRLLDQ